MNILKEIEKSSRFEIPVFEGKLLVSGRVLSASEVEQIGLGSTILATELFSVMDKKSTIDEVFEKAKNQSEDLTEQEMKRLVDYMKAISPDTMASLAENQDKILCKVIDKASMDSGDTWIDLRLTTAIDEMNADNGILWVGTFSREDKNEILNKAMSGHQEAVKRITRFQKG